MQQVKLTHDLLAFQYAEDNGGLVRVFTHTDAIDNTITVIVVDAANNIEDHAFQYPAGKCLKTAEQDLIAMFKIELGAVTH